MKHEIAPGTRYGKLTFVETVPTPKYKAAGDHWGRWSCTCGGSKIARVSPIRNGVGRDCGCGNGRRIRESLRAHYAEAVAKWAAK